MRHRTTRALHAPGTAAGSGAGMLPLSFALIIVFERKKNSTRNMMAADMIAELSQNDCQVGK